MLQDHFRAVRKAIADERFDDLATLPLQRPTHFNWYAEVFEGICLKDHPDSTALIWTDGAREERHTYRTLPCWRARWWAARMPCAATR